MRAPGSPNYLRLKSLMRDLQPQHGVRGRALPEHRRVLEPRHRDVHDSRRRVHARLRVLRRRARPARTIDAAEPDRVADAVQTLGLNYVVITSVDRDDVKDGGASIFAETDPSDTARACPSAASRC